VNRCALSRLATSRTRRARFGASARPCVRNALCSGEFPLASPLPSLASAARSGALFDEFPDREYLSREAKKWRRSGRHRESARRRGRSRVARVLRPAL
jgi:hypothetical protein